MLSPTAATRGASAGPVVQSGRQPKLTPTSNDSTSTRPTKVERLHGPLEGAPPGARASRTGRERSMARGSTAAVVGRWSVGGPAVVTEARDLGCAGEGRCSRLVGGDGP